MEGIIFGLFSLTAVLLFGAVYNMLSIRKPGFYPPKKVLKKRATVLAITGLICLLIGIISTTFKG